MADVVKFSEPFDLFAEMFTRARAELPRECFPDPNAMSVATVGAGGRPSNRIVLLKAFAYFTDRYELLDADSSSQFTGATYTDLNALMPAKLILLCIAVFCALGFFAGMFLRNLQLPAIALVATAAQAFVCNSGSGTRSSVDR